MEEANDWNRGTFQLWINRKEKIVSFQPHREWLMMEFKSSSLYALKLTELVELSYRFQ